MAFNLRNEGKIVCRTINEYIKNYKSQAQAQAQACKLTYLDDRFEILRRGLKVIELGSSPGTWTKVLIDRVLPENHKKEEGFVLSIDRLKNSVENKNVKHLLVDLNNDNVVDLIKSEIDDVDLILSDLNPKQVGLRDVDHDGSMILLLKASEIVEETLKKGGSFVCKILYGKDVDRYKTYLKSKFDKVNSAKPTASRGEEEMYFVCRDFFGKRPLELEVPTRGGVDYSKEGLR